MHSSASFPSPPLSVRFFCSCDKVKVTNRKSAFFCIYLVKLSPDNHNRNSLDTIWTCTVAELSIEQRPGNCIFAHSKIKPHNWVWDQVSSGCNTYKKWNSALTLNNCLFARRFTVYCVKSFYFVGTQFCDLTTIDVNGHLNESIFRLYAIFLIWIRLDLKFVDCPSHKIYESKYPTNKNDLTRPLKRETLLLLSFLISLLLITALVVILKWKQQSQLRYQLFHCIYKQ